MVPDLLQKLEQKVAHALEIIELLQQQNHALAQENSALKNDHDKWRQELASLLTRLDKIETHERAELSLA